MMKRLFDRITCGFSATVLVTIFIQISLTASGYEAVTADFAARFASRDTAVLVQILLIGCIGAVFAGASAVFENERWSYPVQGLVHFAVTAAVWIPVQLLCWKPDSIRTLFYSLAGWLFTYALTWLIQYLIVQRHIRDLNRRIRESRGEFENERD